MKAASQLVPSNQVSAFCLNVLLMQKNLCESHLESICTKIEGSIISKSVVRIDEVTYDQGSFATCKPLECSPRNNFVRRVAFQTQYA